MNTSSNNISYATSEEDWNVWRDEELAHEAILEENSNQSFFMN